MENEPTPSPARGSQSHPHPVAEGRQSPGLEEAAKFAREAIRENLGYAGYKNEQVLLSAFHGLDEALEALAAPVPAGLAAAVTIPRWAADLAVAAINLVQDPSATMVKARSVIGAALAAPVPAGLEEAARAVVDASTTGSCQSEYSQNVNATCSLVPTKLVNALERALAAPGASQEEGPAGVDLEGAIASLSDLGQEICEDHCDHYDNGRGESDHCSMCKRASEVRQILHRLRAQAPASSPRDLEAVPADGLRMICRSYMYVQAGPLRDAANWIARVLAAKDFPQETEAWKRAHPPKGETPSEAAGLAGVGPTADCERHGEFMAKDGCAECIHEATGRAAGERIADLETWLAAEKAGKAAMRAIYRKRIEQLGNHIRRLKAAPGTAIEKAARDMDAIARKLIHRLDISTAAMEGAELFPTMQAINRNVILSARASLSSLPQEGQAEAPILRVDILASGGASNTRDAPEYAWRRVKHLAECHLGEGAQEPKEGGAA